MFGGSRDGFASLLGDSWSWDGTTWAEEHPAHTPTARKRAMATAWEGHALLFGGAASSGGTPSHRMNDTWVWSGSDWTASTPIHSPSPREGGAIAELGGEVVLFSGTVDGAQVADTWIWDGSDWSLRPTTVAPVWRSGAAFATLGDRVVLFGGHGDAGAVQMSDDLADTWTFDGSVWKELHPPHSPSARDESAVATVGNLVVLFGGAGPNGPFGDTWIWDGTDWSARAPAHSPGARIGAAAGVLDGKVYLVGGFNPDHPVTGNVWMWDGKDWTEMEESGPPPRSLANVMSPLSPSN